MDSEEGGSSGITSEFTKAFKMLSEASGEQNERRVKRSEETLLEGIKLMANQLADLRLTHMDQLDNQRRTIKTPIPKYGGNPGEFEDWKRNLLTCVDNNGWKSDEVMGLLPGALVGEAYRVFQTLSAKEKVSRVNAVCPKKHA